MRHNVTRFVSLLLVLMISLACTMAFAAPSTDGLLSGSAEKPVIEKEAQMTGNANQITYTEDIGFTVEKDLTKYTVSDGSLPTVGTLKDDSDAYKNAETITIGTAASVKTSIVVNLPTDYTKAGIYDYIIKEKTGNTQGMTYNTENSVIHLRVYVEWKTVDGVSKLVPTAVIYIGEATADAGATIEGKPKKQNLKNLYEVGSLTVTKEISGNLADPNRVFEIEVTLKKDPNKTVQTPITIVAATTNSTSAATTKTTVTAAELNAATDGVKVTLSLTGNDSYTFQDIPYGVTYTVVETADTYHIQSDETQLSYVNDPTAYAVSGEVTDAKEIKTGNATASETVKNVKEIVPPTGVVLDTLPYVLLMAFAVVAIAMLTVRRREEV